MTRTARLAVLLTTAVLVATGCAPAADPAATGRAETPSPTPSPSVSAAPCILGSWVAGAEGLQPVYDALPSGLEYPAAVIDPAATANVTFSPDGTFTFAQDVPTSVEWLGRTATVVLGGTMTGIFTAEQDALTLESRENLLTVVPADDDPASAIFATETAETLAEWPVSTTSHTCDAHTLVLRLDTEGHAAELALSRVP